MAEKYIGPLKLQLHKTWSALSEDKTRYQQSLSAKLIEVQKRIDLIEQRYAFGEINSEIFSKFSTSLYHEKEEINKELQKTQEKLSNPKELIDFVARLLPKLASIWEQGNYEEKIQLQKMIFPQGLAYDAKKEDYRTPKYNSVFGYIAELVKDLKETKNRTSHFFNDQSGSVPRTGLEPVRLTAHAPQTCLSTSSNTWADV